MTRARPKLTWWATSFPATPSYAPCSLTGSLSSALANSKTSIFRSLMIAQAFLWPAVMQKHSTRRYSNGKHHSLHNVHHPAERQRQRANNNVERRSDSDWSNYANGYRTVTEA